jgi:DNA phosphorothioation system restriction enzyme
LNPKNFSELSIISGAYTNSGSHRIADFMQSALLMASRYDRGVGYFSSGWLRLASNGMTSFATRGGRARWVTSPILAESDWDALFSGEQAKVDAALKASLTRSITDLQDTLQHDTLTALSWMVADGILDFRLAVPQMQLAGGEFHDKFGIFTDFSGKRVSFNGSYNDSIQGSRNYESIKVFCDWEPAFAPLVQADARRFEKLWNNEDPNVRVYPIPEAALEQILKLRPADRPYPRPPWVETLPPPAIVTTPVILAPAEPALFSPVVSIAPSSVVYPIAQDEKETDAAVSEGLSAATQRLILPKGLDIREYQREAIRAWGANQGRGIFAMATGTGKTITALTLATKVAERYADRPFAVIVLCPYINLCRQWEGEFLFFGVNAIGCYEGRSRWEVLFDEAHQRLSAGLSKMAAFVVSNATFLTDTFQARLRSRLSGQSVTYLIIADEAHNLGAKRIQQCLPHEITLRLALSATPDRHHDPEGTKAIFDYFGKIVYTFPLARAIAEGYLTPYEYHPILVTLSPEEAQQYWDITRELSRFFPSEEGGELGEGAMRLLIKRARLIGAAADKLTQLDALLTRLPEKPRRALFYCGDGRVTDHVASEDKRQIEAVAQLLGNQHNLRVRTFTYQEKTAEREDILRDLRSGFLDGVVAIRCLDEGIDLPALETGFLLASSSNPRQFVQRRGRLLRKAPGKDKATIYDFVVVPPPMDGDVNDAAFNLERRLFQGELRRITEFCQTALNGYAALETLAPLRKHYNLLTV